MMKNGKKDMSDKLKLKGQDEQIMGILKYLTEWLVNHILYVDGQIAEFVSKM